MNNLDLAAPGLPKAPIVTKAFFRSTDLLEITRKDTAEILGISEATVSRILTKGQTISMDSKEGEIALIFLRIFRSLDSLFGGNEENARAWLNAHNHALGGVPKDLIKTIRGLLHVSEYLDAMRGKV